MWKRGILYSVLVRKPEEKRPLRKSKSRWDDIKTELQ
jgi:hypothetical protein